MDTTRCGYPAHPDDLLFEKTSARAQLGRRRRRRRISPMSPRTNQALTGRSSPCPMTVHAQPASWVPTPPPASAHSRPGGQSGPGSASGTIGVASGMLIIMPASGVGGGGGGPSSGTHRPVSHISPSGQMAPSQESIQAPPTQWVPSGQVMPRQAAS